MAVKKKPGRPRKNTRVNAEMTSAERIITKFGAQQLADALGLKLSTVYRWNYPRDRQGQDGTVPARYHVAIWQAAKQLGIKLTRNDFLNF